MIKMICGVYGMRIKHPDGRETIKGMGPNDGPFSLTDEQEKRLVERKVAVYVETPKQEQAEQDGNADEQAETEQDGTPIGFDEQPPEGGSERPAYSIDMKVTQLREIGAQHGLTFKVGISKEEMVAAFDKHFAEYIAARQDGNADVDDAPTFDPAGAVV